MAQNPDGYIIRKQGSLLPLFLGLIIPFILFIIVLGYLSPIHLGRAQEFVLERIHGDAVSREDETFVENCIDVAGQPAPQTVIRTRRKVTYRDGYSVEIITREPHADCP